MFFSIFSKQNCIRVEKHKIVFFVFPRIKIHGRLTKNHELFWNSCHLLPASKRFSKSDIYLISLLSGRGNHQKTQHFHFFWFFLKFFEHFERNQDARSVFNFVIFEEFGSLIMKICGILPKSMVRSRPLDRAFPGVVAFYLPYAGTPESATKSWVHTWRVLAWNLRVTVRAKWYDFRISNDKYHSLW